jgi:hypothetical protein
VTAEAREVACVLKLGNLERARAMYLTFNPIEDIGASRSSR